MLGGHIPSLPSLPSPLHSPPLPTFNNSLCSLGRGGGRPLPKTMMGAMAGLPSPLDPPMSSIYYEQLFSIHVHVLRHVTPFVSLMARLSSSFVP